MRTIHIDFQAGFSNDTARVSAGPREIAQREGLDTDYSIGLAGSVRVNVPETSAELEITVPTRGLRGIVAFEPGETTLYLGISILGNELVPEWSSEPSIRE